MVEEEKEVVGAVAYVEGYVAEVRGDNFQSCRVLPKTYLGEL
jgi:hypothetical protein